MPKVIDAIATIIVALAIDFVGGLTFALCKMASKWDDVSEEYWNEYWGKEEQKDK